MKTLHFRGTDPYKIAKNSIAVVGSRRMTRYGRDVVDKFVSVFVAEGITTISGFMYGVDTEVHQKTVDYGGRTIAVFGCGLNVIYPPENRKLYEEIIKSGGSVVSEYDDDAKPHLWKFPQRNKVVAGLASLGVLVVEAGEKSGALITADLARKMKKKVYAVPGPITSAVSAGCNELIRSGKAEIATDPYDILKLKIPVLLAGGQISKLQLETQNFANPLEGKIFKSLQGEALNTDEIAAATGKNIVEISKTVSLMAIRGILTESGGKYYLGKV